jgi:hypothetical protein
LDNHGHHQLSQSNKNNVEYYKIWNREKNDESDGFDTCQANPDLFNNYFLAIAEKVTYNICNNNKIGTNNIKNPIHYSTQIYKNLFPKVKFNHTSTK